MSINDRINLLCLRSAISGCAITVIRGGGKIYEYFYGFSNIERGVKISSESIFHIASVTKTVTSAAIINIIRKIPKHTLKTKVYDIIKKSKDVYGQFCNYKKLLENTKKISIADLLSHRSGLRHYSTNKEFTEHKLLGAESKEYLDNLAIFGNDPLLFEPGEKYSYSSYGYIILTVLIEVLSGTSYFEYIKKEILEPFNMCNTIAESDEKTVNQYYRVFKYIDKGYKKAYYSDFKKAPKINTFIKGGAGMLLSTADDMAKFGDKLIFGDFFDAKTKSKLFRASSFINEQNWHGLGWHQDKKENPDKIWHSGGAIGGYAYLEIDIKTKMVFSLLCNTQVTLDLSNEIIKAIKLYQA